MTLNRSKWVLVLCVAALAGCGGSDPSAETDAEPVAEAALDVQIASADEAATAAATPDEAAATPDQTVATPDEAAATPDQTIAAPDQTVAASDEAVAASDEIVAAAGSNEDDGRMAALAVQRPNVSKAIGFGRHVTGGGNAPPVRVKTVAELAKALCSKVQGSWCVDNEPRVIEVASTIDFTGTEGSGQVAACNYSSCSAPWKPERLALLQPNTPHCKERNLPTFQISYDKAGAASMLIGSNKTLIGVGSAGVIKGKGLIIGGGVSNVIVRNLTFSDINPGIIFAGDAIRLGNTDRVWIDHNRFARIGRQMLVTGMQRGAASNVTVSWNEFDGRSQYGRRCDGKHYWNVLLLGQNDSMTFASNWIHNFSGRGPDIHGESQTLQFVNNYFQDGSWYAFDAGATSRVLIEGNYFQNVVQPIVKNSSHGFVFAPLNSAAGAKCNSVLARHCTANVATPMPAINNFTLDAAVLNAFKAVPKDAVATPYGATNVPQLVPKQAGPGHLGS